MRRQSWMYGLVLAGLVAVSVANAAAEEKATRICPGETASHAADAPARGAQTGSLNKANLINHGGPTITNAKAVLLFWGPSFAVGGADNAYATTLQAFRNQLGTTPEYNVISQYSGIQLTNLGSGTADGFDVSTPPANVTDAIARSKVNAYLSTHAFNASTIYVLILPRTSYSSNSTGNSCGGPNPAAYCAYHDHYTNGGHNIIYAVLPWPGCSSCMVPGWSNVQNAEHFLVHEIRECVTDPMGTAWFDSAGNEADEKCVWSPAPFIGTGGYAYQYEWSNLTSSCVKTL